MTGGLIQLISKGLIDNFITDIPEITFFKSVYHRHTNFAIETFEEVLIGGTSFGNTSLYKVNTYADLLSDIIIRVNLPSLNKFVIPCVKDIGEDCYCGKCTKKTPTFSWVNAIGHVLIEYVELQIGGKVIDKQYGEWFEIWTELCQTQEKKLGYQEMIGKVEQGAFKLNFKEDISLFIPMNFWFCRNIGFALPIVSLYNEDIFIKIKWREFNDCYVSNVPNAKCQINNSFNAYILVDQIYLDEIEREKFLMDDLLYAIDQSQYFEYTFSKAIKNPKIDLGPIFHPVKELIWVLQRDDINQYTVYNVDGLETIIHANDWFNYCIKKNRNKGDTFGSAKLILNGNDRFKDLSAQYFRLMQPYKYHTRVPSNYIYCYSFSLKPEELQPTGSCNFSVLTNAYLNLRDVKMESDYTVKVWAINLNFLLISNGMSGLVEP
jgi:hypothetical protein